jgi:molecular chaperone GrpE
MNPEEANQPELEKNHETIIATLEKELAEAKQRYFSLAADFDNARKRASKEYEAVRFDTASRLLKPILEIVDDFERALETEKVNQEGFLLIKKAFEKFLQQNNVSVIISAKHFDPEMHEAVMHVVDSGVESGLIVAVLQKGYLFQDKVLRPAKVSVAQ